MKPAGDKGQMYIINQTKIKAVSDKKLSLAAILIEFIDNPSVKKWHPNLNNSNLDNARHSQCVLYCVHCDFVIDIHDCNSEVAFGFIQQITDVDM